LQQYKVLGFNRDAYDEREPQGRLSYAFLWRDNVHLHLTLGPTLDPRSTTSCVYLYVDDSDALDEAWRAAAPSGELRKPAGASRSIFRPLLWRTNATGRSRVSCRIQSNRRESVTTSTTCADDLSGGTPDGE
jgi:hypothetical protein